MYCMCVCVCVCVLYYCHRVATQLQLTNISIYNRQLLYSISKKILDKFTRRAKPIRIIIDLDNERPYKCCYTLVSVCNIQGDP